MAKQPKRFLVSVELVSSGSKQSVERLLLYLNPSETHHLKHVLRIKEGAVCIFIDPHGNEASGTVESFLPDGRAKIKLDEQIRIKSDSHLFLTVAQAVPQHRKMDWMAEKAAELGIDEIIPLVSERTVARMEDEKKEKAIARWRRIAEQTIKQSRISKVPKISEMASFDSLCSRFKDYTRVFLFHTGSGAKPIQEAVHSRLFSGQDKKYFLMVIGPEGGFSQKEVERATQSGAEMVSLGSGILKTDTAFLAVASFFKFMSME